MVFGTAGFALKIMKGSHAFETVIRVSVPNGYNQRDLHGKVYLIWGSKRDSTEITAEGIASFANLQLTKQPATILVLARGFAPLTVEERLLPDQRLP